MIKWLICLLWGHKFEQNKICPFHFEDGKGNRYMKGGAKECNRCGKHIITTML